jgi:ssDNA-binding Zn-finger/Zn-ribbon topoisomerase 1
MALRPSKFGLFYGCSTYPACKAAHGAHPDGKPLGIPATKEGKLARIKAHDAFDKLWNNGRKDGSMSRKAAYRWMQTALSMTKEEAHIGNFDIPKCERLVAAVEAYLSVSPI